ncbi:MAG: PilZ domain-containing protein [Myxococcaceae bacterium]
MRQYWVCDAEGRVLGPLPLEALGELIAGGRLHKISGVSSDGKQWVPWETIPEVARFFQEGTGQREQGELKKALQLRAHLASLKTLAPHDVLGVAPSASLEEYRNAFFALAKKFHPARLAAGTHPELRDACLETFQFLSQLMASVEKNLLTTQLPPAEPFAHPVTERTPKPQLRPEAVAGPPATPAYQPEDFVGLSRGKELIEATVRVTPQSIGIFTEHHTVNIRNEGAFLPTTLHLPLGTLLNVHFVFEENSRKIDARARVVWENATSHAKAKQGFGVRLLSMRKEEKEFLREYVNNTLATQAVANAGTAAQAR